MDKLTSMILCTLAVLLPAGGFDFASAYGAGSLATVTVDAGGYERIDTPVCVSLAGVPLGGGDSEYALVEKGGATIAAQVEEGEPAKLWFVLAGRTAAGTRRVFDLAVTSRGAEAGVSVVKTDKYVDVVCGGEKVLRYNHAVVPPPAGQDKLYERSGFIHPLWSPTGAVLTDIHPPDHIHHMGIWMPWTHTEFEGKATDFWNLKEGQGTVRFVKFVGMTAGPVFGGFKAEQEHVALKTASGEKVVLDEQWDVRVYNVGGKEKGYRLWDFVSTQRCVADSPLKHVKYRYGGFGFRGARQWRDENAAYLTSEGKTRKDGHATRARWCDASGKIDEWEGVTFYSHPENFQHPEPMRIWPPDMRDVFFNWAPGQIDDWEMKPGEDHVFRYRMYVHEGRITVPAAERIWRDYAEPPTVSIRPAGAVVLFDGGDLSQWAGDGGKKVGWEVADGVLTIVPGSGSIVTKRDVTDFQMHIEFRIPELPDDVKGQGRGNSGVYIQRRYEVQILDSYGLEAKNNECASIYKFKAPEKNVCSKAGQWQSYDITFQAARYEGQKKVKNARLSLRHNGVLVHDDVEVPNKTGAGRPEGPDAGPILLQDHGNAVSFRNIWLVSK
ncbi:MAG: PmoA family protein [Sedimentisphaerales bacterium]|nr:PmoA family protein [Sedimentisphaerales bacterium]